MYVKALFIAGLGVALVLPLHTAPGQTSTAYNVAAGLTIPTGTLASRASSGFNVTGGISFAQPGAPMSFRIEGAYDGGLKVSTGNVQILSLVANGIYSFSSDTTGAYLIAGLGYYNVSEPDPIFVQNDYSSEFGINGGGGYRFALSGFSLYVEARWQKVFNTDYAFIPIKIGVTF